MIQFIHALQKLTNAKGRAEVKLRVVGCVCVWNGGAKKVRCGCVCGVGGGAKKVGWEWRVECGSVGMWSEVKKCGC